MRGSVDEHKTREGTCPQISTWSAGRDLEYIKGAPWRNQKVKTRDGRRRMEIQTGKERVPSNTENEIQSKKR